MRSTILLLGAASLLAACATTSASTAPVAPVGPPPTVASATPQSPLAAMLANAGRPNAPDLAAVERAFGQADIRRQDGAGTLLTYRLDTCALMLIFTADGQNAMRLSEAHADPRRVGAPAPSIEQCANEVSARGSSRPPA
ncbi:MAG TPA: hypothetical protein VG943_02575 [Caulobacterales bacterium]|nr:hypothetical protein [Caulobacterales bacterium]